MENGRKIYEKIKTIGDSAIFIDEISSRYLTNFYSTDGVVIVTEKATFLAVDSRYIEAAEKNKKAEILFEDVEVVLLNKDIFLTIEKYASGENIVYDSSFVSVALLEELNKKISKNFVPQKDICAEFRAEKSESEIKNIKAAQAITDAAFLYIINILNKNMTERDVAAELEYFMRKNGADNFAFDTIAVSGKNSSLPHGVPSDEKLTENSFLTMDFGAKYNGYCSDMTRTVVIGKADEKMKHVYSTVLQAQLAGINFAKAGIIGADADKTARDIIYSAGYEGKFGHSLGHSLGLEIHESPRFAPSYKKICNKNVIMTVEPGIYLEGMYGVRIEDMVLLLEDKNEVLTHSPKNLIEI
ncbi:MAG: aminopeptidase P family protein [Clostridia bacterium]